MIYSCVGTSDLFLIFGYTTSSFMNLCFSTFHSIFYGELNWYYIIFAKVNKPPPPPPPNLLFLLSTSPPSESLFDSLFIYFHVLGELWSSRKFYLAFSSHPKLLATLIVPMGSSRTFLLQKFTVSRFALIPKWSRDKTITAISWSAGKKWKHNLGNS